MSERPFEHERLDAYHVALDLIDLSHAVIARLPRGRAGLADQLERAAVSIALNIAEGAGEFSPKEKARFHRIALRSAGECAAIVDVAHRIKGIPSGAREEARALLSRLTGMLIRLARHHES